MLVNYYYRCAFDAVVAAFRFVFPFTSEMVRPWPAAPHSVSHFWMKWILWMIKLQYNHICVWFISSAIYSRMHFLFIYFIFSAMHRQTSLFVPFVPTLHFIQKIIGKKLRNNTDELDVFWRMPHIPNGTSELHTFGVNRNCKVGALCTAMCVVCDLAHSVLHNKIVSKGRRIRPKIVFRLRLQQICSNLTKRAGRVASNARKKRRFRFSKRKLHVEQKRWV